jgi:hypothetical protein
MCKYEKLDTLDKVQGKNIFHAPQAALTKAKINSASLIIKGS